MPLVPAIFINLYRAPGIGSFVGIGPVYRNTINPPPLPSVK